jgi:serine/threonine-protein kinase
VVAGTPLYMAPEQAPSAAASALLPGPTTDVYALACTAFELLTNRPPFGGDDVHEVLRKHAEEPPPRLSSLRSELVPLDDAMARALAKRPADRFADCVELRAAFDAAADALFARPSPSGKWRHASVPAEPPGALRVLVVDDDEASRRFATRATQLAMPEVLLSISAVGSEAEAIDSARRSAPRLLILDYDTPGLDGIATLSRVRALAKGTDVRVLVVSARVDDRERWKFGVLGVHDFLQKPVQLPELVQAIDAMAVRNGWVRRSRTPSI